MLGSLLQTPVFPILTNYFLKLSKCRPIMRIKFGHFFPRFLNKHLQKKKYKKYTVFFFFLLSTNYLSCLSHYLRKIPFFWCISTPFINISIQNESPHCDGSTSGYALGKGNNEDK